MKKVLNPYNLALLLAIALGFALVVIGAYRTGVVQVVLIATGTAFGPSGVIALLFRLFLVEDVEREFVAPLNDQVSKSLDNIATAVLSKIDADLGPYREELRNYHEEMTDLNNLREAGLLRCYRNRDDALHDFWGRIHNDAGPMVVTGSTLKGVLPDTDCPFASEIRRRPDKVSFVLMHPVVADLRGEQENIPDTRIGQEIVDRLRLLKELGVSGENIYLRRGTPTCFGIMTDELMLLNTYPYLSSATGSPCQLISRTHKGQVSYLYATFQDHHFNVQTSPTERVSDLGLAINRLGKMLEEYRQVAKLVKELSAR